MILPNGKQLVVTGEDGLKHFYDPEYARAYYLRTRKLKGPRKKAAKPTTGPTTGLARNDRTRSALKTKPNPQVRAKQRQALAGRIKTLESKLHQLEAKIKQKQQEERESAKESAKPDSASEKRKKAKDSEKYRDKNKQKLKNAAKKADKKDGAKKKSSANVAELKKLATKVKGQIAVAKQRLAAL